MSQETRSSRLTGPLASTSASGTGTAAPSLMSLFAAGSRAIDLLPHLHRHALDATGGGCSLLFEYNPRSGALHATSGYGLDELRVDPWSPGPGEATLLTDAFTHHKPVLVTDLARQMPDLAPRLGTPNALLIPLAQGDDPPRAADDWLFRRAGHGRHRRRQSLATADAFVTALELLRLRRRDELQRDLRELIDEFSASISATLNLAAGLEIFCVGANRLFGADRTSVWVHDRRGRQLVLQGSSDPEHVARGVRVSADDALAPAAVAMRRSRAEIMSPGEEPTSTVTVPLRGYRRALGTIVFEGVRVEAGGELDLLDPRRRARPPAVQRHRDDAAARRRDPVAARARERVRLDLAPGGRRRSLRQDRPGQRGVREPPRAIARRAPRPDARRMRRPRTRGVARRAGAQRGPDRAGDARDVRDDRPRAERVVHVHGHRPVRSGTPAHRHGARGARSDAAVHGSKSSARSCASA